MKRGSTKILHKDVGKTYYTHDSVFPARVYLVEIIGINPVRCRDLETNEVFPVLPLYDKPFFTSPIEAYLDWKGTLTKRLTRALNKHKKNVMECEGLLVAVEKANLYKIE